MHPLITCSNNVFPQFSLPYRSMRSLRLAGNLKLKVIEYSRLLYGLYSDDGDDDDDNDGGAGGGLESTPSHQSRKRHFR